MINKPDDIIDSVVDQKQKMLDIKLGIDKPNNSGVIMDDENYSLKSPENGSITRECC